MKYVEDYLEYIAAANPPYKPVISLARYDVNIVASMAHQTINGVAFTDKQAVLAHKIVVKYKRQLLNQNIDLGSIEHNPEYRLPIRSVDRAKEIVLKDNVILLRFPYDDEIIQYFQSSGKSIPGRLVFDRTEKVWSADIGESRLLWLETLVDKYHFDISDPVKKLVEQVKQIQSQEFKIELTENNGLLNISNAETSLVDYINDNLGGFEKTNLLNLIDNSSILGYSVDKDILEQQLEHYGPITKKLLLNKVCHLPADDPGNLEAIAEYARLVKRDKIVIYDPMLNANIEDLDKIFGSNIAIIRSNQRKLDVENHECLYLTNWMPSWKIKISLLLTFNAMMIGPKKQSIMQYSDKIVFCTKTMYN